MLRLAWRRYCAVLSLSVLLFYAYHRSVGSPNSSDSPQSSLSKIMTSYVEDNGSSLFKKHPATKYVLYWNEAYGSRDFGFGSGYGPFAGCPVRSCYATSNRSYIPVDEFHAVMFHARSLNLKDIPLVRSMKQKYIFWSLESPQQSHLDSTEPRYLNGLFNWTMTYREDSDLVQPYGWMKANRFASTKVAWKHRKLSRKHSSTVNKTGLVAWFVSNCKTPGRREDIVSELQNHVPVTIYGKCGNKTCVENDKCEKMISEYFKFYLAFENSACKDYVTEKFYKTLKLDVIPIAFGGANYSSLAPEHSYINVEDFSDIRELAEYLKFLDEHDGFYNEYFWWKKHFRVHDTRRDMRSVMCGLCAKLHTEEFSQPKVYADMERWWIKGSHCKTYRKKSVYTNKL